MAGECGRVGFLDNDEGGRHFNQRCSSAPMSHTSRLPSFSRGLMVERLDALEPTPAADRLVWRPSDWRSNP